MGFEYLGRPDTEDGGGSEYIPVYIRHAKSKVYVTQKTINLCGL